MITRNAPGWYPDPHRADILRWWDGIRWTEHHRTTAHLFAPHAAHYPPHQTHRSPSPAAAGRNHRGRNLSTVFIVLITVAAGWYVWRHHEARNQWYQEGYALGSQAVALANAVSPESSCTLALANKVPFGADDFAERNRVMERGCVDAVHDIKNK